MMFMKENDLKIKLKDLDNIFILMVLNISDIERWINKMERVYKVDLMEPFIGEIIKMARKKGMEFFSFLMEVFIKEN